MSITDELESTYIKLLRAMQDSPAAYAVEHAVKRTKLADGRVAQITIKINTDQEEWI